MKPHHSHKFYSQIILSDCVRLVYQGRDLGGGCLGTPPPTACLPSLLPSVLGSHMRATVLRVNMFYVNNNCKLDFKLGHVTNLITMFQPLLLLFVQKFKCLLMAYKVIRDLTPIDSSWSLFHIAVTLRSLATATPGFCLILRHSKFIPTCYFLCLECGLPGICMTGPFLPFRSHLTCHLL